MTPGRSDAAHEANRPVISGITAEAAAVIAQVCSSNGVVWIRPNDDTRHHLAWHVWHNDAVHVISGVGEQRLPMLIGTVEVAAAAKGSTARTLTYLARAESLTPGSEEWQAAADAIAAKRLNAVESPAEASVQRERWATECLITRLVPTRMLGRGPEERGSSRTAPLGDAAPRPSAATTLHRRPWHLGGRPDRNRNNAGQQALSRPAPNGTAPDRFPRG
jgi:hypothetical protein